jgi:hypothetical protein
MGLLSGVKPSTYCYESMHANVGIVLIFARFPHPFAERLIGTVSREYLDHVFFWNAIDLRRKLDGFADYYNAHRVHRSLDGTTPTRPSCASSPPPARAALRQYAWEEHCRGLFHTPIPA